MRCIGGGELDATADHVRGMRNPAVLELREVGLTFAEIGALARADRAAVAGWVKRSVP